MSKLHCIMNETLDYFVVKDMVELDTKYPDKIVHLFDKKDVALEFQDLAKRRKAAKNGYEEIEVLISETKDNTLFKLPPISTFIFNLKEIIKRSKK